MNEGETEVAPFLMSKNQVAHLFMSTVAPKFDSHWGIRREPLSRF